MEEETKTEQSINVLLSIVLNSVCVVFLEICRFEMLLTLSDVSIMEFDFVVGIFQIILNSSYLVNCQTGRKKGS